MDSLNSDPGLPLEVRTDCTAKATVAVLVSVPVLGMAAEASSPPFVGLIVFFAMWVTAMLTVAWPAKVVFRKSDICIEGLWSTRRYEAHRLQSVSTSSSRVYLQFSPDIEVGILQSDYPVAELEKRVRELYLAVREEMDSGDDLSAGYADSPPSELSSPMVLQLSTPQTKTLLKAIALNLSVLVFLVIGEFWLGQIKIGVPWAASPSAAIPSTPWSAPAGSWVVIRPALSIPLLLFLCLGVFSTASHLWTVVTVTGLGELLLCEDRLVWRVYRWNWCVYFSGKERVRRQEGCVAFAQEGQWIFLPHGLHERDDFKPFDALLRQRSPAYQECLTARLPFEVRTVPSRPAVVVALLSALALVVVGVALLPLGAAVAMLCTVWCVGIVIVAACRSRVLFSATDIYVKGLWRRRRYDVSALQSVSSAPGGLYLGFEGDVKLKVVQSAYPVSVLEEQVRALYSDELRSRRDAAAGPLSQHT